MIERVVRGLLCVVALLQVGCADDGVTMPDLEPRQFLAGELDPFGCPFVDPVPGVDETTHAEVCGPGCEPRGWGGDFVACFGEDVPPPPAGPQATVIVTLCHPVSGGAYDFPNPGAASPFAAVCFSFCNADESAPSPCFEERPESL